MENLHEIEEELKTWVSFHNNIVGVLAFSFALGCLSLPFPISFIASLISIAMTISLMTVGGPACSPKFRVLRQKAKTSENHKEILQFAENNFLSGFKYLPFNIGYWSLVLVWLYSARPLIKSAFNVLFSQA